MFTCTPDVCNVWVTAQRTEHIAKRSPPKQLGTNTRSVTSLASLALYLMTILVQIFTRQCGGYTSEIFEKRKIYPHFAHGGC